MLHSQILTAPCRPGEPIIHPGHSRTGSQRHPACPAKTSPDFGRSAHPGIAKIVKVYALFGLAVGVQCRNRLRWSR
jgi:hypothetical protein